MRVHQDHRCPKCFGHLQQQQLLGTLAVQVDYNILRGWSLALPER